MSSAVFLRLLKEEDKGTGLIDAVAALRQGQEEPAVHVVDPNSFSQIPGSPFAYWVSEDLRRLFVELPPFEGDGKTAKVGLQTGDDFRFVRTAWEINPGFVTEGKSETPQDEYIRQTFQGKIWSPFAKGGAFAPFYTDIHLLVNWKNDGEEIRNLVDPQTGKLLSRPQNTGFYFRQGLTWSDRTTSLFSARAWPAGGVFSVKGSAGFYEGIESFVLGLMNSSAFNGLLSLVIGAGDAAARSYQVGTIGSIPFQEPVPQDAQLTISRCTNAAVLAKRSLDTTNETSHAFTIPTPMQTTGNSLAAHVAEWQARVDESDRRLAENQREIDDIAFKLYGISDEDRQAIEESLGGASSEEEIEDADESGEEEEQGPTNPRALAADLVSYALGCVFGRWDIRMALDPSLIPALQDPFDPLPVCSPAMLIGTDGLPATIQNIASSEWLRARENVLDRPDESQFNLPRARAQIETYEAKPGVDQFEHELYPLVVDWDGILVDEPEHKDDIVRRVEEVLEMLFGDRMESFERDICAALGVSDLRTYFRKSGSGGFWMDHVRRYSKSRRKAPIYWLLQSSKGNYAVWLYYHRLDRDILYKALVNYVEPKMRLEQSRLDQFRSRKAEAGTSGKQARDIEKMIDRQESFISELSDFRDKLRRAADLHLDPDLNDGVILNIAPLREIVPWPEAKKFWNELMDGKYEWSSVGKQLKG